MDCTYTPLSYCSAWYRPKDWIYEMLHYSAYPIKYCQKISSPGAISIRHLYFLCLNLLTYNINVYQLIPSITITLLLGCGRRKHIVLLILIVWLCWISLCIVLYYEVPPPSALLQHFLLSLSLSLSLKKWGSHCLAEISSENKGHHNKLENEYSTLYGWIWWDCILNE